MSGPWRGKGKGKAKARGQSRERNKNASESKVATRKDSLDSMEDELEEMTEAWIEVLQDEVKLLEYKLARLKRGATPFSVALTAARAKIDAFEKKNQELRTMAENREQLKAWLDAWVKTYIVHQGGPNYMEVTLLQDDYNRHRGCVYMTNRTHIMSQNAYPYKHFGNCVEDKSDVNVHLGEDSHGVCIQAFESHLQFTVEGNYENVAKTWQFDFMESTPQFTLLMREKMDDDIHYIIQEHNQLKVKRISVSGVFRGYPGQNRITITHAGIALDERFPFIEGETRSNGFQWTIFEHITDHLTLVRWSLLHFCSVNADGPLSLHGTARLLRCPMNENDTDEGIIVRCRSAAQKNMENFRDHIRKQFERFKLEGPIIRSQDQFFETTIASSRANY